MKLTSVTVQLFRNFVQAQTVAIEPDVTVLVGKNESGKTTFLKALHRLNPANLIDVSFALTTEYPRWRLAPDRRANPSLASTYPVSASFDLEDADVAALSDQLPVPPPPGTRCTAWRNYDNTFHVALGAALRDVLTACATTTDVTPADLAPLLGAESLDAAVQAAKAAAKDLKENQDTAPRAKALTSFASTAPGYAYLLRAAALEPDVLNAVAARVPKFFYFSTYQSLPGESDLTQLAAKVAAGEELLPQEQTVIALLAHAGEKPEDFLDDNYDSRKAELQAASVDLSRHVFEYWRQNTDLSVIFDTDNVRHDDGSNHRLLKIEIRDARHGDVETNFATRSAGFQWFFSFFAAFSQYQESPDPIIVLLDEPGTSLHGEAQQDFVKFVSEELVLLC
jgi:energy-coupling factor transporter ATP-binding protein EcfA2